MTDMHDITVTYKEPDNDAMRRVLTQERLDAIEKWAKEAFENTPMTTYNVNNVVVAVSRKLEEIIGKEAMKDVCFEVDEKKGTIVVAPVKHIDYVLSDPPPIVKEAVRSARRDFNKLYRDVDNVKSMNSVKFIKEDHNG